ncbi:MAG: hypothetical protein NW206_15300 [Hyphomonadaceae bacterium]|nr:hypothetical protein [Hyphomonadaceae bacterium]
MRAEYVFGDGNVSSTTLIDKMSSDIEGCDHTFFDITGFNPNVMIELGMAYQHKKHIYFMYDERRHKNAPATKAIKEPVPTNIRGQDHFAYSSSSDFDRKLRSAMRNALGIGKNSVHELKIKINSSLAKSPQRISEIAKTIGDVDQQQLSDVLNAMRTEGHVFCTGHGMGAKWQLSRRY